MAGQIQCGRRVRRDFGKIASIVEIPNLIEIQRNSYEAFLQKDYCARAPRRHGAPGGVQERVPHLGLQRERLAGVRGLPLRRSQVHGRGVSRSRHDARHSAQGDAPPGRVRAGQERAAPGRQGHQGAGGLPRRAPAHDREGHLHHQRHRARGRQPAPALGRGVLRRRPGQDAGVGEEDLLRPDHPVPRLVGGVRVRRQRHPAGAHRPPAQDARDRVSARLQVPRDLRQCQAEGRRPLGRGDPRHLLRPRGGRRLRGRRCRRQAEPGDPSARDAGRGGHQAAPAS